MLTLPSAAHRRGFGLIRWVSASIVIKIRDFLVSRRSRERTHHGSWLDLFEIYCKCPVQECERRDTKGFYKKAILGIVTEFMGISSLYEEPVNLELILDTNEPTLEACVDRVVFLIQDRSILSVWT